MYSGINPGSLELWINEKKCMIVIHFLPSGISHFWNNYLTRFLTLFPNYSGYTSTQSMHRLSFSVSLTIMSCLSTASSIQGIFIHILGFCSYFCAISQISPFHFFIPEKTENWKLAIKAKMDYARADKRPETLTVFLTERKTKWVKLGTEQIFDVTLMWIQ